MKEEGREGCIKWGIERRGGVLIASCETKQVCQKVAVCWCNTYQTGSAYRMGGFLAQTE